MIDDRNDTASPSAELLRLTSQIVAAYVSNNAVPSADLPVMIKSIHATLGGLNEGQVVATPTALRPAVPVKKSVTPEYIICLEDGKKLTMLKRYLRSRYNMSPEQYRTKWGLPADYPMVAPNYAQQRSEMAKRIGLGRIAGTPAKGRRKGAA